MFTRLRNRFILTTMAVATVIMLLAFTTIFAITAANVRKPRQAAFVFDGLSDSAVLEIEAMMDERLEEANAEHLTRLALVLVSVGCAVEILVFVISYYMAERNISPVKEAYRNQREFIANASHELKTPLAIIQANFEALEIEEKPWTDNISLELGRANRLVADLLSLARAEEKMELSRRENFDMAKDLRKMLQEFEPRLEGRQLELSATESLKVEMSRRDWEQIVGILLDNAMKYAKTYIKINLCDSSIEIMNDGRTIGKEKLSKIFERFYQVDKTAEGSGLGLAIAQAVAQRNKWNLSVKSENGVTSFKLAW